MPVILPAVRVGFGYTYDRDTPRGISDENALLLLEAILGIL